MRSLTLASFFVIIAVTLLSNALGARTRDASRAQARVPVSAADETLKILRDFFESTNGFSWKSSSGWLKDTYYCNWYGIRCRQSSSSIIEGIVMVDNKLEGTLSESLFRIGTLKMLDLSRNKIGGRLSPLVGHLSNLTTLNLSSNEFQGDFPASLVNITQLSLLNISNNAFSGSMPQEYGQLSSLITMDVSRNKITSLPRYMDKLSNLQYFNASRNLLGSNFPTQINELKKATTVDLSFNRFYGTIPRSFSDLYEDFALKKIDLSNNQFTSMESLPTPVPFLTSCDLSGNNFRCPLPRWTEQLCQAKCF